MENVIIRAGVKHYVLPICQKRFVPTRILIMSHSPVATLARLRLVFRYCLSSISRFHYIISVSISCYLYPEVTFGCCDFAFKFRWAGFGRCVERCIFARRKPFAATRGVVLSHSPAATQGTLWAPMLLFDNKY